jgi:hypothetical protein
VWLAVRTHVPRTSEAVRVQVAQPQSVRIEWSPAQGVEGYRVYRTGTAGTMWWHVTEPRFTDSGQLGTSAIRTSRRGGRFKNLLELKNAVDVTIDGNVLENHWASAQSDTPCLFTPRNQEGRAPWARRPNTCPSRTNVGSGTYRQASTSAAPTIGNPSGRARSGFAIRQQPVRRRGRSGSGDAQAISSRSR